MIWTPSLNVSHFKNKNLPVEISLWIRLWNYLSISTEIDGWKLKVTEKHGLLLLPFSPKIFFSLFTEKTGFESLIGWVRKRGTGRHPSLGSARSDKAGKARKRLETAASELKKAKNQPEEPGDCTSQDKAPSSACCPCVSQPVRVQSPRVTLPHPLPQAGAHASKAMRHLQPSPPGWKPASLPHTILVLSPVPIPPDPKPLVQTNHPRLYLWPSWLCQAAFLPTYFISPFLWHQTMYFISCVLAVILICSHSFPS